MDPSNEEHQSRHRPAGSGGQRSSIPDIQSSRAESTAPIPMNQGTDAHFSFPQSGFMPSNQNVYTANSGHSDQPMQSRQMYPDYQQMYSAPSPQPGPSNTRRRGQSGTGNFSSSSRNTYTIETKIKVAEMGLLRGRNIAAKEFGLNGSMVGRWMRSIDIMRSTLAPSHESHASDVSSGPKRRRLPDGNSMVSSMTRKARTNVVSTDNQSNNGSNPELGSPSGVQQSPQPDWNLHTQSHQEGASSNQLSAPSQRVTLPNPASSSSIANRPNSSDPLLNLYFSGPQDYQNAVLHQSQFNSMRPSQSPHSPYEQQQNLYLQQQPLSLNHAASSPYLIGGPSNTQPTQPGNFPSPPSFVHNQQRQNPQQTIYPPPQNHGPSRNRPSSQHPQSSQTQPLASPQESQSHQPQHLPQIQPQNLQATQRLLSRMLPPQNVHMPMQSRQSQLLNLTQQMVHQLQPDVQPQLSSPTSTTPVTPTGLTPGQQEILHDLNRLQSVLDRSIGSEQDHNEWRSLMNQLRSSVLRGFEHEQQQQRRRLEQIGALSSSSSSLDSQGGNNDASRAG
ncbi:hypothetical protein BDR26DRAFT_917380 [Obelidium mucronatum]|nr:hypothetical protein BDR26DRAFT_917380 [Obelidium mucronatum]